MSDPLVEAHREEILGVARRHGAIAVRLFGSRARGEARGASDLDLLVSLDEGTSLLDLVAMKQEIEELLGCPVDVVSERALSPHLRERILAEAAPL